MMLCIARPARRHPAHAPVAAWLSESTVQVATRTASSPFGSPAALGVGSTLSLAATARRRPDRDAAAADRRRDHAQRRDRRVDWAAGRTDRAGRHVVGELSSHGCVIRGGLAGSAPNATTMNVERLREARRDAQREAAPFTGVNVCALVALAVVSRANGWELLGRGTWWLWLVVAAPLAALTLRFVVGLGRLERESGRAFSLALLAAVGIANGLGVVALVASLAGVGAPRPPSGGQLLASGFVVLLTNVVTFALVFWELDMGGPIRRALTSGRRAPDFQFPQDENPELAAPDWEPRLLDYAYVALTNSSAFSATDVMPLSRQAKVLMALESMLAVATVLIVAARAVNVLK